MKFSVKSEKQKRISKIHEAVILSATVCMIAVITVLMIVAIFDRESRGEAPLGSFEVTDFNDNWYLSGNRVTDGKIALPYSITGANHNDEVRIINTLPDDLSDGSSLMVRSVMEDIYVYIDGNLRASYATELIDGMSEYIPSAYVVTELNSDDAGKKIEILIRVKTNGIISGITIAHGNNVWFPVLKRGIFMIFTSVLVLVSGLILFIAAFTLRKNMNTGAAGYLGLLMINIACYVISESILRQFIFVRPSLSQYFSYFTMELIGVIAALYFDEVQHKVYHKAYLLIESVMLLQILANIIMNFTGICSFYRSMIYSHIWSVICAVISIVCVILDIKAGRVKAYRITAIGIISFVLITMLEVYGFYVDAFHLFGKYLHFGLILLMGATVAQLIHDERSKKLIREKDRIMMTMSTIETVANAVDAKDEYAGGHNERVSVYAEALAREVAEEYELTEEDIIAIRYTALMHDIGKIGVADNVINKEGNFTEEEFSLMRKHAEIGFEVMNSMGWMADGLLDGIKYHHERYDGNGYPDGLSGEDIPLVARIICIADSFDAMTSARPYRKTVMDVEAREELINCSGTQFDPKLVKSFVSLIDRGEIKVETFQNTDSNPENFGALSNLLLNRLKKDLMGKKEIISASHVRMLCYIMKLMEDKDKPFTALFVGPYDRVKDALKENTGKSDINIRYTRDTSIVVLFNSDNQTVGAFITGMKDAYRDSEIEYLS